MQNKAMKNDHLNERSDVVITEVCLAIASL